MDKPVPAKRLWKRWKAQTTFHFPTAPATRYLYLWDTDSKGKFNQAPHQVHAALLEEGSYVCSPRTMYRLLEQHGEVRERRDQLRHPVYRKPELLATPPNQ